jgi:endonuclease/exonuclease/phosphatase (EEP) superfamily protein YafD
VRSPAALVRSFLVPLSIVVVLVAGAGTLLGFAARHDWRLELACHPRVQYWWALAAAFCMLAWTRHRILAFVAFALAVTNLVLIAPLYFGPASRAKVGAPLRAMSLNVHYLNEDYGSTIELILREQPDFVLLVEVTREWAKAMEFLNPEYPYRHVHASDNGGGLAFYSRHEIKDVQLERRDWEGPTMVALVETPEGPLTIFGVHPHSPKSVNTFESRNRQLEHVAELARGTAGPVVLMGDLNMTSWSPYFGDLLAASQLRDSRRGFGVEPSWPWLPGAIFRIPIDHCLVSPGVSVLSRWIGPAVGSDHRPVFIEFALAAP